MAVSLRGVARKYLNVTGNVSVRNNVFGGSVPANASLRNRLVTLARKQYSFSVSECVFGWTAAFEQTWSHINIRIRLNPDAGITAATVANLQTTWRNGIVSSWSDRWGLGRAGEMTCPLTFDVQWVTSNQHHTVRIRPGPARSNMGTFDDQDPGSTAAHEYGHMFGLVDEYAEDDVCPNRNPKNTGTIMDNNTPTVPARMMNRFATNVGSNVVAI